MADPATILFLFGLSCADPCPLPPKAQAALEQAAVRAMGERGFEVRPPPPDALRPTGPDAALEPRDEARQLGAGRVVVLDYAADTQQVWVSHFVLGTVGPWSVSRVSCPPEGEGVCPGFEPMLLKGLRPRSVDDVDFIGMLRTAAGDVGACVAEEDQVPAALRTFGRVELDLTVRADGKVEVSAVAPARVAKSAFGICLRAALERRDVGPFEGGPVKLRIPLDL